MSKKNYCSCTLPLTVPSAARCPVSSWSWPSPSIRSRGLSGRSGRKAKKIRRAGGIYLFANEETALAYLNKHTARLKSLGVNEVICKIFDVNEPLTALNHGHLQ
ncbi:protein ydhR [Klebsiella michiganensis]|uniref:Protein ydhR n=1 Tax=Klebsiella michiganensis TaxID=1134687 RepID=A0A7H4N5S8_9ENTR|nr:protein ydhR [Klebsiella michiganensis]